MPGKVMKVFFLEISKNRSTGEILCPRVKGYQATDRGKEQEPFLNEPGAKRPLQLVEQKRVWRELRWRWPCRHWPGHWLSLLANRFPSLCRQPGGRGRLCDNPLA